jgi:AraC-like DNA-binding protein
LHQKGLLKSDAVVESLAQGRARAQADRTLQRHFRHITGMTPSRYKQIVRALRAAEMLRAGRPAIEVAYELGYADQFHLSKSVKQVMGQTPSEIVAAQE